MLGPCAEMVRAICWDLVLKWFRELELRAAKALFREGRTGWAQLHAGARKGVSRAQLMRDKMNSNECSMRIEVARII